MKSADFIGKPLKEPKQTNTAHKKTWAQPQCSLLKISATYGTKISGGFDNESGQGSLKGAS